MIEPGGGVAVVTGASRGLGAGLAAAFSAAESASDSVRVTGRRCPKDPTRSPPRSTSPTHWRSMVSCTTSWNGSEPSTSGSTTRVYFLRSEHCEKRTHEDLRRHFEVNVLGVALGSAAYARHVRGREGGGVLVNISSGAATTVYVGWAPYCASKAAVDMLTAVVAKEERDAGLTAYALSPGAVDTDMQSLIRATPATVLPAADRFRRLSAEGRFNSPEWVAEFILGLLHPGTARRQTGQGDEVGSVRVRVPDEYGSS